MTRSVYQMTTETWKKQGIESEEYWHEESVENTSSPKGQREGEMKQTVDHRSEMKRLKAGGIYQDAAGGRRAGSALREDSQPTRCRWAAANALLISDTEKIPPHRKTTFIHSCLTADPDSDLAPVFRVEVWIMIRFIFLWEPRIHPTIHCKNPSFITMHRLEEH